MGDDGRKGPPKPTEARFALAANVKELMRLYNKGFGTGITPTELEQGSGISAKTVRRVLDPYNDINPNLETIDALAAFFRIPAWELLRRRDKQPAISGRERQTPETPVSSTAALQQKTRKRG